MPHFYSNNKYIHIYPQDVVPRGVEHSYYDSAEKGDGVEGCLSQLNNINSLCGCILTLTHFLSKKAGIQHRMFKHQPEQLDIAGGSGGDEGLKGLLDSNVRSLANTVTSEAARTNYRVKALEAQVSELEDLLEALQSSIDELSHDLTC